MSKKFKKEIAIVVFLGSEEAEDRITSFIESVMRKFFPFIKYCFVCIREGDNLAQVLSSFDPKVFVFDLDRKFVKDGFEHDVCEIVCRLCHRYSKSFMLILTRNSLKKACSSFLEYQEEFIRKRIVFLSDALSNSRLVREFVAKIVRTAFYAKK